MTNLKRALLILLENEEDMALLNLSLLSDDPSLYDLPLRPEILDAHAEVELIVESYLNNLNEIITSLEVLAFEIASTQSLLSLRLDTARNKLLYYTTFFTLLSMGVGKPCVHEIFSSLSHTHSLSLRGDGLWDFWDES